MRTPPTLRLAALAATILALAGCLVAPVVAGGRPTTIILVRHAEKGSEPADDPGLTETGRARAERLARLLAPGGVRAIVTSQYARTRMTAEPIAKRLGLTPAVVPLEIDRDTKALTPASRKALVDNVLANGGRTVLVVGHSNTTQELIEALGGGTHVIDEKEFDDLFVVTLCAPGSASVVRLKY